MKVIHIVAGNLDGGAARGAYWLHQGLLNQGVNSTILTDSEITFGDETVESTTKSKKDKLLRIVRENIDYLFTLPYRNRTRDLFSSGLFGINIEPFIKDADIVHLHWVNNGFFKINQLKKIEQPVVWTIRDMWPVTGGCHFAEALNCDYYKTGCRKCKLLGSKRKTDFSTYIFNRKKKSYSTNIHPVGISNWMTEKVEESFLFRSIEAKTIFNNIDTQTFFPVKKQVAKEILHLETKKKIVLCGATCVNLTYKGFNKFLDSLKFLNSENYLLVFFGKLDHNDVKETGYEYRNFGFLHDNVSLRLLYSAADAFVASSIMEPFGKTLGEAMACETPVVCFDATGPKDIVDHKQNGYNAKPFSSEDLATGIKWVLENNADNKLGKAAREKVFRCFSEEVVAKQYVELYKSLLNESTT